MFKYENMKGLYMIYFMILEYSLLMSGNWDLFL